MQEPKVKFMHGTSNKESVARGTCVKCGAPVPTNLLRVVVQGGLERPRAEVLCPPCLHGKVETLKQFNEWFSVREYVPGQVVQAPR